MSALAEERAGLASGVPQARWWRGLPGALCGIVLAVLVAVLAPGEGYYLNIVMQAVTYAVAVSGLVVVLGYCGQISLAQAAFLGVGAYGVGLGTTVLHLPFLLALLLGVVAAAAFGLVLGLASLRLGGHYLAMVSISFQQILQLVATNWIGLTGGPDGVSGIPRPALLSDGHGYLGLCLVVLVLVLLFVWRLKASRLGRAMMAVRDNEIAAGTGGINAFLVKVLAFGISAALGGLGGGLFAGAFAYVSPDQFGFDASIVLLTMALLGGVESPFGALLGTVVLVLLPEWLRFLKGIYLAVYGAAVILIMIFVPQGVWGLLARRFRVAPPHAGPVPPLPLLSRGPEVGGDVVLSITGLAKHFGGLKALDGVDLQVRRGTVHALIGPNGSGKTTFLNVVSGLYVPTAGRITLGGAELVGLGPHRRTRLGLCRTFQNIRVWRGMSVLENVLVGAERPGTDVSGDGAGAVGRALAALEFVGLRAEAARPVGSLSYGLQRYVEIARALAGSPDVLLLDEPAAGLNSSRRRRRWGACSPACAATA